MSNVVVSGAQGKMGGYAVQAVQEHPSLTWIGNSLSTPELQDWLAHPDVDIVIDFTTPDVVYEHACLIIEAGKHPVIGTTGLTPQQLAELRHRCQQAQLGAVVAPNFSLGVHLMIKTAQMVAAQIPQADIIEWHHDTKKDRPSGTALRTERQLATITGEAIPIHSVRLPGLLAHQAIMFGGMGETLTIRHDALDRSAFMPGLMLACERVSTLNGLIEDLEPLLWPAEQINT